jgi:hypothetical protein
MDEFDAEIKQLEQFIDRAADSLLTFYVPARAGFRRSTLAGSGGDGASATSTTRALFALAEYVRFLQERDDAKAGERLARTSRVLLDTTSRWVLGMSDPRKYEEIRSSSDNDVNHFTDSHLLMAVSLLPRLSAVLAPDLRYERRALEQVGRDLRGDLVKHLRKYRGGKIHDDDPATHDFITLHALRAIDSFARVASGGNRLRMDTLLGSLRPRVEHDVLARLGCHSAHVYAEWDPAELLFTAALLERCETPNWTQLLSRTVEVVVKDQTVDGAWLGSRVVLYGKRNLLHVASYEVGLTLTYLAPSAIRRGDEEMLDRILLALRRVCGLAESSFQVHDHFRGWANDRTRWPGLLESWATAIVLTMLLRCRETLLEVRQARVLQHYRCRFPASTIAGAPAEWEDLRRTLRVPHDARHARLAGISDPSPAGELVEALRREVLAPILLDPAERPVKAGLILHGSPGTRKTTMVKEIAGALGWPMVTLSPPDFLGDGGLDGFEKAAARVFTDLGRLRRVVVLFDECEDFFRPRPPRRQDSSREDASSEACDAPSPTDGSSPADASAGSERAGSERGTASSSGRGTPPDPERRMMPERSMIPETRTIGAFITAGMLPRLQDLRDAKWTLFVLATNVSLDELDEAAIRPGRFDFAQDIDDPVTSAQVRYAQFHRAALSDRQRTVLVQAIEAIDMQMPFRAIDVAAGALIRHGVAARVGPLRQLIEDESELTTPPTLY